MFFYPGISTYLTDEQIWTIICADPAVKLPARRRPRCQRRDGDACAATAAPPRLDLPGQLHDVSPLPPTAHAARPRSPPETSHLPRRLHTGRLRALATQHQV